MYERLELVSEMIENEIKNGNIAGASAAVFYKGKEIYGKCFGHADREKGKPMKRDTIFRLFSMTKPITATAAMILLERGKLDTKFPVKWFLPTFENPMVLDENGLRPASRDVTIGDLLNMTSGIVYPDGDPAGRKMGEEVWWYVGSEQDKGNMPMDTKEFALAMGKIPLAFDPGEKWRYGSSADVLGAVIEVISGMRFSDFLKKEIFEPLGMKDTDFYVPAEKYDRFAQVYEWDGKDGIQPYTGHNLLMADYDVKPRIESGGAGLVSTIDDYSRFARMLINGGELDGVRILGRKTVDFMTENKLNEKQREYLNWDSLKGYGYGCLMRILMDKGTASCNGSIGEFGWDGWVGNIVFMDRTEDLCFLYFIQKTNAGGDNFVFRLKNIVYSAI